MDKDYYNSDLRKALVQHARTGPGNSMDKDYYNSDLRKALVLFGLLDGLLFTLAGYVALRDGRVFIYNVETVLSLEGAMAALYVVFVISLVPTCFGLVAAKRWAMVLSCVQLPFRILFRRYTLGILMLVTLFTDGRGMRAVILVIVLLEFVRLIVTLIARRKSFSDEWHGFFDNISTTKKQRLIAGLTVAMVAASVFTGWDRREPSQKLADASRYGHLRTIERLIAEGVDVNETSSLYGFPALNMAVFYGRLEVVQLLLEYGAEPDAPDNDGLTPIHRMVKRLGTVRPDAPDIKTRVLSIIEALIEHHADLNVTDKTGKAPLHDAVINGHPEMVRFLLKHGADVNAADNEGHTPLHHATRQPEDNEEIIELLRKHGATE